MDLSKIEKQESFEIIASSPKALERINPSIVGTAKPASSIKHHLSKYPFNQLEVGQSFAVPIGSVNSSKLRVITSQASKRLEKLFTVVQHKELELYEVARIG